YCVGVTTKSPERSVKELQGILDDEALLTPNLLRLTRWMADYYLCGWGQVLNAVVPAGARERAGTRNVVLLEAVAEDKLTGAILFSSTASPARARPRSICARLKRSSARGRKRSSSCPRSA